MSLAVTEVVASAIAGGSWPSARAYGGVTRLATALGGRAQPYPTGVRAVPLVTAVVLVAICVMSAGVAGADNPAQLVVSVVAANGTRTVNIPETTVASQYDLSQVPLNGGPASGMSVAAVAEYVHVAPESITSVTVSSPPPFPQSFSLTGSEVVTGFPNGPNGQYAMFQGTDAGNGLTFIKFVWPGSDASGITSGNNNNLSVGVAVSHSLLAVGPPTVSNSSPTAGASVQFGAPTVSLNDSPAPGPLIYSWNFGDGSSAGTGSSPSHVYPASGTWLARVTVTDVNGDQGVSPALSESVGQAPPKDHGRQGSGGGGSSLTGGGSGLPTGVSSGARTGKANVPATAPKEKSRGRTAKKRSKGKTRKKTLASTAAGGSGGSGSGGSGGAAGFGTGGGSGAGSAGSGGASKAKAGGTKAQLNRAGGSTGARRGALTNPSVAHPAVPAGLVGVLVDASGGTPSVSGPISDWLSAVHAAARASGGRDKPVEWQWLLGVFAVVIWILAGATRELGPPARLRVRRLVAVRKP